MAALLAGPSLQSARIGTLRPGEVVAACESRGNKVLIVGRGWCLLRTSDKVLLVQLGGGVVPASVPAAKRQQEVIRRLRVRQSRSEPALQTKMRRRPSSAPARQA